MAKIDFGGVIEDVITRSEFSMEKAREVLKNETIAILGYGVQGPAQGLNLRDNGFNVIVGQSKAFQKDWDRAVKDGWVPGETLFEVEEAAKRGTIIEMLVSDAGQRAIWPTVSKCLNEGDALYFSHGFSIVYKEQTGVIPPKNVDVIMVAPKGSGLSVRRNFLAGVGINSSYAVQQDFTGRAEQRTLALGIGVGSGYLFPTTFQKEVFSDLTGERGTLMGCLAGILEAQYDVLRSQGHSPSEAFNESVEEYRQSLFPVKWVDWQDFRSEFSDDASLDVQGGQGVAGVVACGSGDTLAPIKELILKNWEKFKAKHKNIVDFAHDDSDDQKILAKLNVLRENLSERRITSYKRYQAMVKQRTFEASTLEQECLELLKANYNLILSGAPGTGKTYIAKRLAVHLIKENKLIKAQDVLSSCIKNFKKQDSLYEDHERLRRNFLEEFSLEKLSSLTLEKYCIGKGDNKSFCWWMEFGLKSLGSFSPGMSDGYLIYWSKDQQRYILSGYAEQLQKAHTDWNIEEIFNDIKEKLVSLIKADFQDIPKFTNYFLSSFVLKILSTYRNQEFFPINSNKHLTNLIEMLGVNCSTDADVFTKNQEIYNFYKKCTDSVKNNEACEMSPECFNDILYANFDIEDKTINMAKRSN